MDTGRNSEEGCDDKMTYWLPQYKWQLVDWLAQRYPGGREKFKRMAKKRLYAIYHAVRKKI